MSSDLAISARNLGKAYRFYDRPVDRLKQMVWRGKRNYYHEFWALRGVDFDIYKGETIGIVGRNGAGKTTLLQLLCGTVAPTEGSYSIGGRIAALLGLGAGFNPEFSGRDNVFLNAAVLGLTEDEIRDRFDDIAAFADIGEFMERPVRTYSSGMYARLAFSVAIHVDPEILIVDEILAVGDAAFQRKCLESFYRIRESGCTILFVSHDPYQVKMLCNRALYLTHGQGTGFASAADIIDRYMYDMEQLNVRSRVEQQPAEEQGSAATQGEFRIISVRLEDAAGQEISEVQSGQDIQIRFRYVALQSRFPDRVCFVVNFYRHDDLYICGTTSLMDGIEPFPSSAEGEVLIRFPRFPMLAGQYKWRVAINDHTGLAIHSEARHACPFRVVDRFRAVGLVDLDREWLVSGVKSAPRTIEAVAEVRP